MSRTQDYTLALLLVQLRKVPSDRLRACLNAATQGGASFGDTVVAEKLLPAGEATGYQEAARYLVAGDHLRACPKAHVQAIGAPGGAETCPVCQAALIRGVLPAPRQVTFEPALERQVRRLILDTVTRGHTQERVTEAARLRREGKVGQRPEAELAPRERAPGRAEQEQTLGPYALIELVGRGGSTYVYKARDTRDGRVLALKVLWFQEGESAESVQEKLARFRREAELASRLEHPNLVTVGSLEQIGTWHCIPMAFVDGPTLGQILEARKANEAAGTRAPAGSDFRALAHALCEVARGLHFAHCQEVVHRDVNPRNILFSAAGQAFLSDFGIARPLESAARLTGLNVVLGLPEYAAPERLESERNADARSDVYSLGVVLYEILAGRVPFEGKDPSQLLARMLRERPVRPSQVNPEVPAALDAVAMKALERKSAARQASALDFAQELSAALEAGDDTSAPSAGPAPRTAARTEAGLGRAVVAVWLAAALLVGGLLGTWLGQPAPGASAGGASGAGGAGPGGVEQAYDALLRAEPEAEYRAARDRMAAAVERTEAALGADAPAARFARGRFEWSQGRALAAEAALRRAGEGGPDRPRALLLHALCAYWLESRATGPTAAARRAAAERSVGELQRTAADSWEGRVAAALGRVLAGDSAAGLAALDPLQKERPDRVEPVYLRAWTALRRGRRDEARGHVADARKRFPRDPFLRLVEPLASLGTTSVASARAETRALAELWPAAADVLLVHGVTELSAGTPEDAVDPLRRVVQIDPDSIDGVRFLARALEGVGRTRDAIEAWTRVLELNANDRTGLRRRGELLLESGDVAGGERDLRAWLERNPGASDADEVNRLLRRGVSPTGPATALAGSGAALEDADGDGRVETLRFRNGLLERSGPEAPGTLAGLEADLGLLAGAVEPGEASAARRGARGPWFRLEIDSDRARDGETPRRPREDDGARLGIPAAGSADAAASLPLAGIAPTLVGPGLARVTATAPEHPGGKEHPRPAEAGGTFSPVCGVGPECAVTFTAPIEPDSGASAPARPVFPTEPADLAEETRTLAGFRALRVDQPALPGTGFSMLVPAAAASFHVSAPASQDAGGRLTTLALLRLASPDAELEVQVTRLPREVSAEDWLMRFIELRRFRVLLGRTAIGASGPAPDWLVQAGGPETRFLFRLAAIKDGPLLYLLCGRVREADYPAVADAFAVAVLSWTRREPVGRAHAEELERWRASGSVPLTFQYPASWRAAEPGRLPPQSTGTILQWQAGAELLGHVTVKAFGKDRYGSATPGDLLRSAYADLERDAGAVVQEVRVRRRIAAPDGAGEGRFEVAAGRRLGRPVEIRSVVLEEERTWIVVSLLGAPRDVAPDAWMVNRRAFELVLLGLNR